LNSPSLRFCSSRRFQSSNEALQALEKRRHSDLHDAQPLAVLLHHRGDSVDPLLEPVQELALQNEVV
jgi:hypothetical protein